MMWHSASNVQPIWIIIVVGYVLLLMVWIDGRGSNND